MVLKSLNKFEMLEKKKSKAYNILFNRRTLEKIIKNQKNYGWKPLRILLPSQETVLGFSSSKQDLKKI